MCSRSIKNDPVNLIDPLGLISYCIGYHVILVHIDSNTKEEVGRTYAGFLSLVCFVLPERDKAGERELPAARTTLKKALEILRCLQEQADQSKKVDELLTKLGLDEFIAKKRISDSGNGYYTGNEVIWLLHSPIHRAFPKGI
ncbi:MAG TPA: hypothetical protein VNO14_10165 [Blastocatellia bacterium]|nr:hypothetical protein [Blastocatellia bacterium]